MLTAVVCCDDRMLFVYKKLQRYMNVIWIDETCDLLALPPLDAIVLPVKGVDEEGYLSFQEAVLHIPSLFWKLQKDMVIFSGLPCPYLDRLPMKKEYYMKDPHVIEENAVLTAEGVLHLLITSVSKSLYEIQVDIIGFGNCGKAIYHMLKNLDIDTRVIRRECTEEKDMIKLSSWKDCGDVIVNTSIQKVIDETRIHQWNKKPLIIDIATPDVVDQAMLQSFGVTFIKAGNLPGRFCAESAGRIIADHVRGKLLK